MRAKKWVGALLCGMLVFQAPMVPGLSGLMGSSSSSSAVYAATQPQQAVSHLKQTSGNPVTSGAMLREYIYTGQRKDSKTDTYKTFNTVVRVILVDLKNPYVNLDVMTGQNGNLNTKNTVLNMAKETQAVAGTNGDFFHMNLNRPPIGPVIDEGVWLTTPLYSEGWYTFGLSKNREPVIDYFSFEGYVKAPNGNTYPLAGINRPPTYQNGKHSHVDKIFMYTPDWDSVNRANDGNTTPHEVLVVDDIVVDMQRTLDLPVPENGYILYTNGKATTFMKQNFQIGDKIEVSYDMKPLDPNTKVRGQDLDMLIGGHALLINNGQKTTIPKEMISSASGNSPAARTAIGYSRDKRYVYLITADHKGDSQGLTLAELQDVMLHLGVWKGMNLDGGGSTTMVARPLGEFDPQLVNAPKDGAMRRVANGIGVYTIAPKGKTQNFEVLAPAFLFKGEQPDFSDPSYRIVKAYDTYFNPLRPEELTVQWALAGNRADPSRKEATVTATIDGVTKSKTVKIVGRDDTSRLEIMPRDYTFEAGKKYKLSVQLTTRDGTKRQVPFELVQWEFLGFSGVWTEDRELLVTEITDESQIRIIARYDGYSTMITMTPGVPELWANFDDLDKPVGFKGYPQNVFGAVSYLENFQKEEGDAGTGQDLGQNGGEPVPAPDRMVFLAYDFTKAVGSTAAYITFNGNNGIVLENRPISMRLNVFGDNSNNWLRAEFVDSAGKLHRVDLAPQVNWTGFKTVEADLAPYQMAYPVKLQTIYIVNIEQGHETRAQIGGIGIDDITFTYAGVLPPVQLPKIEVTIDKHEIVVNGQSMMMEAAPMIVKGRTYVPIYYIANALEGQVEWDGPERKVTLLKDSYLMNLWIDRNEAVVNGIRENTDVAPFIKNQRSMVPLRYIAETFGWNVRWEGETRTVILE